MISWIRYYYGRVLCWLTGGHHMGQHFTAMGLAKPGDNEHPWCDKCGSDGS